MPNLDIPGAGVISFPDDMPKEQIRDIVEKQIMPKAQSRVKLSGGGGNVPNDFHANVPAPTASGQGNPMLAALGLSQIGPVVASGMQPGVGRALVEQVNFQNLALGKMIPAAWPMSSIGQKIVRSLIAAQAMPGVGTAVGQASVDQPGGQRREDITQAGLGVLQGLAAPRVGEMTSELAGRGLSALGALLPKAPAPIPVRQGPVAGQPGYIEAINKTPPKPVTKPAPLPSEVASTILLPRSTEKVSPRPARVGRDTTERDKWDEQFGNMRKGGRSHNDDGTPYQPTVVEEIMVHVNKEIADAKDKDEASLRMAGQYTTFNIGTAVKELLDAGWKWDPIEKRMVNPKDPNQKASSVIYGFETSNTQSPNTPPSPVKPVAPSPFDKGKVMPNQIAMPTRDALRAEVTGLPTDDLTKRYAGTQAVAKMLLQQGRLDEASILITRGQFMREELEKRATPTPSESRPAPPKPVVTEPPKAAGLTPPAASPLTFQPAIQLGAKTFVGVDHGKISAQVLKEQQQAKQTGQPVPRMVHGFQGSDGKFYTTLEAARAKMEQPGAIAPQPKEQNVQASQQARPEETQKPSTPQSNVQKEVPGNVGKAVRGAQPGNGQGVAGGVGQPAKSGLPSNPNKGKTTSESGFILFPGGKASIGKDLGIKSGTKVNGEQLYNRMRNVLGEGSGEFKYWADAGLKGFLASPKTTEEVEKWMNEKGLKVKVMKFGSGGNAKANEEAAKLEHELDTKFPNWHRAQDTEEGWSKLPKEAQDLVAKWEAIGKRTADEQSHWSAFGPKSEQDMPDYVELAVVKPGQEDLQHEFVKKYGSDWSGKDLSTEDAARWKVSPNKFPSSHNYPPNTVAFVRAYIETDAKTGEKTFHVIEVQTDQKAFLNEDTKRWEVSNTPALRGKDFATREEAQAALVKHEPLMAHIERLALKAAIEHARAAGATRIAVSDAETAMMTEGHDQAIKPWQATNRKTGAVRLFYSKEDAARNLTDYRDWDLVENGSREPEQAKGMRLHYDQTLPKILGELTGERGERVEFGAHRMAMQTGIGPTGAQRAGTVPREDLIFKDEKGQPKTTVTARSFPLTNTRKEFSMFGSDKAVKVTPNFNKETGAVQVPKAVVDALADFYDRTKQVGSDLKSFFDDMSGEGGRAIVNTLRGTDLPRTAAADKDVANKLYTYAQANAVSDVLAHTDPTEVLGSHWNDPVFDRKLGGVLVEYNLRQTGNTSIGKPWSPFKDEAQYQAAVKDPEILAAIRRHAEIVLAPAEARHTALGGKKITLPAPEAFVNLKFKPKEEGSMNAASGGLLKATLQHKTRFSMGRKGTGDEYETSYRKIAERMVKGNFAEDLRQKLNDSYVEKGLGVYVKPGDPIPEGMQEVPVRVQRAIIVPEGEGAPTMVNQNKSLYIKKELMPEYLQAMQANIKTSVGGLRKVAEVLTKLQVSLGVDAVQHTVNMVSAVNGAVRPELGKNLIGVKELDTISQIVKNVSDVIHDKPEVQHLIGEMARDYGIAREHKTYEGLLGGRNRAGELIRIVDQAGRVTLFQIARQLADAGMIKNDPVVIREFVNKQLGQYNTRLMSSFNQFAKATFAPFMVAGKTFNRLAATRLLMSPQVKAASPKTWALMRARQALYVASAVVIVPAVANYLSTGSVFGGPDTRFGEIDLGEKGRFDMAKWTLLRRGARISGLQTVGEQQIMPRLRGEPPAALGQTAKQVFSDVGRGQLAPYAGPPVNALATLATGKSALGYEARQPGEKYPYFAAAGRQLNPLIGSTMEGADQGKGLLAGAGKRLEQMAGSRTSNDLTVIRQLARQFNYKQGKASETDFAPSEYAPLLNAVRDGRVDEAKKLTEALVAEKGEKVVEQYFKNLPNKRFTGNKKREDEFVKSLTPHQQDVYAKAKAQNEATAKAFFEQVLGKPVPAKGPKNGSDRLSLGHF